MTKRQIDSIQELSALEKRRKIVHEEMVSGMNLPLSTVDPNVLPPEEAYPEPIHIPSPFLIKICDRQNELELCEFIMNCSADDVADVVKLATDDKMKWLTDFEIFTLLTQYAPKTDNGVIRAVSSAIAEAKKVIFFVPYLKRKHGISRLWTRFWNVR